MLLKIKFLREKIPQALKNNEMIKILQLDYIQIIKPEPVSYKSSGLAKTELFISKECVSNIFSTK